MSHLAASDISATEHSLSIFSPAPFPRSLVNVPHMTKSSGMARNGSFFCRFSKYT